MIIKKTVKSCNGCLYLGQTQNGQPACAKFQQLVDVNESFCCWRIAADQDPVCEKCGHATEGKAIYVDGHVYCQRCGKMI